MKTARLLAEAGPISEMGKTGGRLQEIIEQSNRSANLLHEQAAVLREPINLPPIGPSAEVEAAWTIQVQLPTLVEISAETSRQIGRMAAIAQEGLTESKELRTTMGEYTKEAKRSGDRMTWLTLAIAILTLLLLWKDLELWPLIPA